MVAIEIHIVNYGIISTSLDVHRSWSKFEENNNFFYGKNNGKFAGEVYLTLFKFQKSDFKFSSFFHVPFILASLLREKAPAKFCI